MEVSVIFSGHWILYLFFQTNLDILGSARSVDFSGNVRCPSLLLKLTRLQTSAISLAIQSSYMHVTANKLENSCHWYMSFNNRFDFGTYKHLSMIYSPNNPFTKLTIITQCIFRQLKHRWLRVRWPPSWIWSGMAIWLWLTVAGQKCSGSTLLILWYLIYNIFIKISAWSRGLAGLRWLCNFTEKWANLHGGSRNHKMVMPFSHSSPVFKIIVYFIEYDF